MVVGSGNGSRRDRGRGGGGGGGGGSRRRCRSRYNRINRTGCVGLHKRRGNSLVNAERLAFV